MSAEKIEFRVYLGLFAFVLVAHGLWYLVSDPPPGFVDNDGYVRLLKVEALWRGEGWFDRSFPRANAPYGDVFHWTRPLDVLISALALPLAPVVGVKTALYWAAMWSGPALHAASVVALAWAALPLAGRTGAILAGIAATAQYGLMSYGALVRGDHHVLFVFFAVLGFGFAIRALHAGESPRAGLNTAPLSGHAGEPGAERNAAFAGLAAAAGVWVGPEAFAFVGVVFAAFGLTWLSGADAPNARRCARLAAGYAAGLVGMLAIERGPSFFAVEYDQISIVHATLGALIALFFIAVRVVGGRGHLQTPPARAITALAGGGIALGLWVLVFPRALGGPLAGVDPAFAHYLADNLGELQSGASLERFPATLGATVLAAPWLAWRLWRERDGARFWAWVFVALCVAAFAALTAGWIRWMIYAGVFPCLALGDMVARASEKIAASGGTRARREAAAAAVVALVLLGPPAAAYVAAFKLAAGETNAGRSGADACAGRRLAAALSRPPWSDRPRAILMGMNYVGEILYRTPHRTVGMAYHRAEQTLRDTLDAFAATDDAVARAIIDRRRIELIAICPGFLVEGLSPESRAEGGFYDRLTKQPPAWVRRIETLPEAAAFRLFEVVR
jgi:hypothetical protein